MIPSKVKATVMLRGGDAAQWAHKNPVLGMREPGLELDTHRFKVGDGVKHWNDLPYWDRTSTDEIAQAVAAYVVAHPVPAGAKGDKGDPGQSVKGDKGDPGTSVKGDKGDAGPSGATFIANATITETALSLALLGGVRKVTVIVAGVVPGANYLLFPTAATPAGYAIADVVCLTAGQLQVTITAPALALLTTYTIPVRVVRINT